MLHVSKQSLDGSDYGNVRVVLANKSVNHALHKFMTACYAVENFVLLSPNEQLILTVPLCVEWNNMENGFYQITLYWRTEYFEKAKKYRFHCTLKDTFEYNVNGTSKF